VDQGFGYVGQQLYASGQLLANGALARYASSLPSGSRALVWGWDWTTDPTRGPRSEGANDALTAAGMTVDFLAISDAVNNDASTGTGDFGTYYAAHPDVKLVVSDGGNLTAQAQTFLQSVGKGSGDIIWIGFDMSSSTAQLIQTGWVALVLDQQPYLQGYLPILQMCLTKRFKFAGLSIDTGSGLIDKTNVAPLLTLIESGIR